jgi:hypothetical protein
LGICISLYETRNPILILGEEKIFFRSWPFEEIPYSAIEKAEYNLPPQIAIKLLNPNKYKNITQTDRFMGSESWIYIQTGRYSHFTVKIEYIARIISLKTRSLDKPIKIIVKEVLG